MNAARFPIRIKILVTVHGVLLIVVSIIVAPETHSVGVADLASDLTHDSLVHRADQAVYRAKEHGRNKVCLAA